MQKIDLNQIEKILKKHPDIQDVVAFTLKPGGIVYIVPKPLDSKTELQLCWGEYQLFDPLTYASMTQDRIRNDQYQQAINQLVAGKTVVDIGTGQDIVLTKFCIEAGAKKVYALEVDESAYQKAKTQVKQLGWQSKVTVIQGDAQIINLPEKVDVCVSELIGGIGSSEGTVAILNDARRFLKDDGVMIPYRCLTQIAAVYLPDNLATHPTMNEIGAYYVDQLFKQRGYPFDARLAITNFPQRNIVSDEAVFENLDFTTPVPTDYSNLIELSITRSAQIDGLLLWLNLYTHPTGVVIDTLNQQSNWAPIYFPIFYPGLEVIAGDKIKANCQISLSEDGVRPDYRIRGHVERQRGETVEFDYQSRLYNEQFKQNPFYARLFSAPDNRVQTHPSTSKPLSETLLRDFLQQHRADVPIDLQIIISANLPITNGKIDRLKIEQQTRLNLVTLWTAQAEQNPSKMAVIYQNQQLSYAHLNQQANQLAHHLQQQGVKPEQLVGLSISPSLEMVVAIWGILKAGGAFVPFDPTYPADRLKMMIQESQVDLVVTTTPETSHLASQPAQLICLDELPTGIPSANLEVPNPYHLACCLYTSGSTGQPKGVLIEHQALASHCLAMLAIYEYTTNDRGLLFASLNYVAALEQLFMPLLSGASLIIREPELWNATTFPAKVREYGITVVDLSPGYWHTLLESWQNTPALIEDLPLRLVILGGDETRPETVKLWQQTPLRSTRFLNAYGMTETPVTATLFEMIPDCDFERVPIGRPAPNWQVYLLDEQLQVVPEEEEGEICIGGTSLARGYLNQPTLTAEKFVDNPVGEGRLYRTGDLGRFLPDGNLEYLGRKDYQVQIRGFRVELEEIEAALLAHPMVKEVAVVTQGEGTSKQLVAYAVSQILVNDNSQSSSWHPEQKYLHETGILTEPTQRLIFKLEQHNLNPLSEPSIALQKPLSDDELQERYFKRQSYRQYISKPLSFTQFSQLLFCLYQLNLPNISIPKYRYPSAGGLYPVQIYLYCKPERVENIKAGFYYYHPREHRLQLIQLDQEVPPQSYTHFDQPTYQQSAFSLFFVAHLDAIIPMYGQNLAKEFCLLEAGYIGQLLMSEAPDYGIGLCPIDMADSQVIKERLKLGDHRILVHSFLGGAIEPDQTKTWLQPTTNQQSPADLKADLQSYLKEKLPPHTVPEQLILREQLPRTPNGKVDRQALANITIETDTSKHYIAPRTPMEQSVVQIWQELLKLEQVGVTDEFFALGGNSLLALQLLSKIEQQFQVTLPLQTLLRHNTVEQLAQQVEALQASQIMSSSDIDTEDSEEIVW
ncbi:MAG: amino acid adenylation domain-containing protein [Candidatus Electrothrix sp. AU1_5]|nr:amino acid adenylation domain-containing protein [Candidatus Electrothrix gigas]